MSKTDEKKICVKAEVEMDVRVWETDNKVEGRY